MSEIVDMVFSGSGTNVPCHVGAYDALLDADIAPARVAGTSGGAIIAAGIAAGWEVREMMELAHLLLRHNTLLDPQIAWYRPWGFFRGYGLHAGDKGLQVLREHLPGRMEDADMDWGVWVLDLETQRPVYINSRQHGHVEKAEAVMASCSVPVFFRTRPIKGMPSLSYTDGGASVNFGMGVFDDRPDRRTIGVRFAQGAASRRRIKTLFDFGTALAGVLVDNASNTHISQKRYADVIEVISDGNGLAFDLSPDEIRDRYHEGRRSAEAWLNGPVIERAHEP